MAGIRRSGLFAWENEKRNPTRTELARLGMVNEMIKEGKTKSEIMKTTKLDEHEVENYIFTCEKAESVRQSQKAD